MQGTDERYRLSVAFQVRPVMIVPAAEPHAALLVGIDYTHRAGDDHRRGRRRDRRHPVDRAEARPRRAGARSRPARRSRFVRRRSAWQRHRGRARRCGADHRRAAAGSRCRDRRRQPRHADRGRHHAFGRRASAGRAPAAVADADPVEQPAGGAAAADRDRRQLRRRRPQINGRLLGTGTDDVVVAFYQRRRARCACSTP